MRDTHFIFVEGVMGAGKTTATETLVSWLREAGAAPRLVREDGPPLVALTLPHPNAVWEDATPEEYVNRSLELWRRFVAEAYGSGAVTVCDGLLFHGNMTDLLLMDTPPERLRAYVAEVLATLTPLRPCLIYLRFDDLTGALRAIFDERGPAWEAYQIGWKVGSPHGVRRGLSGFAGFASLYEEYRALCDDVVGKLAIPHVMIQRDGDWERMYAEIRRFLDFNLA